MIRRLTVEDLTAMFAILDTRNKIQDLVFTDEWRERLKRYYTVMIDDPFSHFFGWFDENEKLIIFRHFVLIRGRPSEVAIGATWKLKAVFNEEEMKAHKSALENFMYFVVDHFKILLVDTYWRIISKDPSWTAMKTPIFENKKLFRKFVVENLSANTFSSDASLNQILLPFGPYKTPQEIVKYVDRNPIPWPPRGEKPAEHVPPPRAEIKVPNVRK
jgi:hypothetical protein